MNVLLVTLLVGATGDAARPLMARAQAALEAGEYATAVTTLDEALRADPDDVDALYAAGLLALRLERTTAVALLARLLQLDPYNDEARLHLATARWRTGDIEGARGEIAAVLARHPGLPAAEALARDVAAGPAPIASPWRLAARLDLGAGYDSNLATVATALDGVVREDAVVGYVDVAAALAYATAERPLVVHLRLASLRPLTEYDSLAEHAATVVGGTAVARRFFGRLEAAADLRYDEVFTDAFSTHRGRLAAPSVHASWPLGERHRLRLLAGGEWRDPAGPGAEPASLGAKVGLRDAVRVREGTLILDLLARRLTALEDAAGFLVPAPELAELSLSVAVELPLRARFAGFALATAQLRRFFARNDVDEQTYRGEAGLRLTLSTFELHAEYAYTANRSEHDDRRWHRHALFAGVRVWTP